MTSTIFLASSRSLSPSLRPSTVPAWGLQGTDTARKPHTTLSGTRHLDRPALISENGEEVSNLPRHPSRLVADLALLLVTAIWGSTFVIVKDALGSLPPNLFNALRFAAASAIILSFGGWRALRQPQVARAGVVAGFFLALGYILQTAGLVLTTPARAGFITGLSVVLVPVFLAVRERRLPGAPVVVGASASLSGLWLLTVQPGVAPNLGDLLVLGSAVCFAAQIITVGHFAGKLDVKALAAWQLLVVTLMSGVCAQFERWPSVWPASLTYAILFTAVFATALALLLQTSMQRFTTASHTALIFSAEPVFAALISYLWLGERLGSLGITGAALIMLGILVAEVLPIYLKRSRRTSPN